jgi:hypothetical protein
MLENVLILLFAGLGALLVVADAERSNNALWLNPDPREGRAAPHPR